MKSAHFIDPQGIPRECERAAFRRVLITEGDRLLIGFLAEAERLTCLEHARVFSLALKPGADPEEARSMAQWLFDHLEGLDAVCDPGTRTAADLSECRVIAGSLARRPGRPIRKRAAIGNRGCTDFEPVAFGNWTFRSAVSMAARWAQLKAGRSHRRWRTYRRQVYRA
jgi:hypothetical protein